MCVVGHVGWGRDGEWGGESAENGDIGRGLKDAGPRELGRPISRGLRVSGGVQKGTPGIGSTYFPGSSGKWGRAKRTPGIRSTYVPGSSGRRGRPKRTQGIRSIYFPGSLW